MKKLLAYVLTTVMVFTSFAVCSVQAAAEDTLEAEIEEAVVEEDEEAEIEEDEEAAEDEESGYVIVLGNSGLTVTTEHEFVEGEISEEDTDENQIAYYYSEDTLLDFDVYYWAKASDESLSDAIEAEAAEYGADETVEIEINGFDVAFYNAVEESDGEEYDTVSCMIDDGDYILEIVFWLDGEEAVEEAEAILLSLAEEEVNEIELGTSGLMITTENKFEKGEISEEDTDESQVAYYFSEDTLLDFDIYQWAKADGETIKDAAAEEAAEFDAEAEETEINGFTVYFYYAEEESEDETYETVSYMIDHEDEIVEIVFWLDGEEASEEADAIIATLTEVPEVELEGVITLGSSALTIAPENTFVEGEITEGDTDENQVAYYYSEDTLLDFDVYQWAKASDETLEDAIEAEAELFDTVWDTVEINGIEVAYYFAEEESEEELYETLTCMMEDGDYFVEIVFWLDGEEAEAEVDAIMETLAKQYEIELGTSGLTISSKYAYERGDITEEDTDESQVAYYFCEDTLIDFDVYQWAKAEDETLAEAIAEEVEFYGAEAEETEINGFDVAYYYAAEDFDGFEFTTVTYIIDNDDEFVEIVFWLDGEDAEAEVDAMINTLAE